MKFGNSRAKVTLVRNYTAEYNKIQRDNVLPLVLSNMYLKLLKDIKDQQQVEYANMLEKVNNPKPIKLGERTDTTRNIALNERLYAISQNLIRIDKLLNEHEKAP